MSCLYPSTSRRTPNDVKRVRNKELYLPSKVLTKFSIVVVKINMYTLGTYDIR